MRSEFSPLVDVWPTFTHLSNKMREYGYDVPQIYADVLRQEAITASSSAIVEQWLSQDTDYNAKRSLARGETSRPRPPKVVYNFFNGHEPDSPYQKLRRTIYAQKLAEATKFGIPDDCGCLLAPRFFEFIKGVLEGRGFTQTRTSPIAGVDATFSKAVGCGFSFVLAFQRPSKGTLISAPLECFIESKAKSIMPLGDLRSYLPGVEEYSGFSVLNWSATGPKVVSSDKVAAVGGQAICTLLYIIACYVQQSVR